jgi:hypothetical protein
MGKFDKNQLYNEDDINTKLLLGKLNTILGDFGVSIKSCKEGNNDNRKYFYKLELLKYLPKNISNILNLCIKVYIINKKYW